MNSFAGESIQHSHPSESLLCVDLVGAAILGMPRTNSDAVYASLRTANAQPIRAILCNSDLATSFDLAEPSPCIVHVRNVSGAIPTSIPLSLQPSCPDSTFRPFDTVQVHITVPLEFSSCYVRIMISAHTGTTVDAYPVLEVYYSST